MYSSYIHDVRDDTFRFNSWHSDLVCSKLISGWRTIFNMSVKETNQSLNTFCLRYVRRMSEPHNPNWSTLSNILAADCICTCMFSNVDAGNAAWVISCNFRVSCGWIFIPAAARTESTFDSVRVVSLRFVQESAAKSAWPYWRRIKKRQVKERNSDWRNVRKNRRRMRVSLRTSIRRVRLFTLTIKKVSLSLSLSYIMLLLSCLIKLTLQQFA